MESRNSEIIDAKIKALRSESATIFDREPLRNIFFPSERFEEKFNPFLGKLEREIKSLPYDGIIEHYLAYWVEELEGKIDNAKNMRNLSEVGRIFLTHRKKLRTCLLQIKSDLVSGARLLPGAPTAHEDTVLSFADIFSVSDWKLYIDVLHKVSNPVMTPDYKYIGKNKKHKGVIGSWIKELQHKGIIHTKYTRQDLTKVLNKEIEGLDLGKDGRTIDNYSVSYENEYKRAFFRLVNLPI